MKNFRPDPFTLALVGMVLLASFLPASGMVASAVSWLATLAIAALFFFQGALLSRDAVVAGMRHWRLHLLILGCTFGLFPLLGLALRALLPGFLTGPLWNGVIFLCVLPSTVQSSIAFTSIGRGNIAAAVCAATASNLLGMFITPVLVGLLLSGHAGRASWGEAGQIFAQLLLPFIAGQALRPMVGQWVKDNRAVLSITDRSTILLTVYSAFSAAVLEGVWQRLPLIDLARLVVIDAVLLAMVIIFTMQVSRLLGFDKPDEVSIVFCGSKKTLASGVPMANVLFPGAEAGLAVLPLMLFHQMQLILCAWLARRYAARPVTGAGEEITA